MVKTLFQVDLVRNITFRNSKQTWQGVPIIAANMDTVGTFEMAKALATVGGDKDAWYSLASLHQLFLKACIKTEKKRFLFCFN